jgi:two-component system chemotaxis response regulator CheB
MPIGGFTAALSARLNKISPLIIKETENGDVLKQGHVFISKAGYHTIISSYMDSTKKKAGKIIHTTAPQVHNVRPAADKTFISASEIFGPHAVSVILSGMGRDGGEGTKAVKEKGGKTFVCRQEDCLVYGMARSALDTNCVDEVLPLKNIATRLAETVRLLSK